MSTVRELLGAAASRLQGDGARFEAELLLAHALDRTRTWLFTWPEFVPEPRQTERFSAILDARCAGQPIAYLTGYRQFWSLDLAVTPAVLIPRADTESLVELALARIPADSECSVADLGTGSGAIALAIARDRPRAKVLATDVSDEALAVARANAQRLGLANITFAQGDWCAALGEARFDLVVSNPPYIASGDVHLAQDDLRFEPEAALVSGSDGLDAIRAIGACVGAHMQPAGWLLIEHGFEQASAVRELLQAAGFSAHTSGDIEGRDRVTAATFSLHT